jgi:tetratricopeptide (TPR) repeat protein
LKVLNGVILLKMEKLSESEKIFKDALIIDQNNIISLKSLGEIEFIRNNFELSKEYFKKVISIKTDEEETYSMLGWVYFIEKNYESALEQMKMALQYDKNNYLYHFRIGRIYWELGGEEI